jgi:phasin family protein
MVQRTIDQLFREPGDARQIISQSGKGISMVKLEEMQAYGKESMDAAVTSAKTFTSGFQAIATAYTDYSKKSFEDTKAFVEKLSSVKTIDQAMEIQTEFAKSAYESFVAESQKFGGMYTDLAKDSYKPYEGLVAKLTPAH